MAKRKAKGPAVKDANGELSPWDAATASANGQEKEEGRMASKFRTRSIQWFYFPWVPSGLLTLVVGQPCNGKSTFIAGLIAMATAGAGIEERIGNKTGRVVLLPGHEEEIEALTLPRLKAAGARLDRVRILDGGHWALVSHKERIAQVVRRDKALVLIGDPIDSYVDEGFSENDGQAVRPTLEAAAWIARQTGAAVVFSRHPGKDPSNILPGSRQWRAVPRSILQLTADGSTPPQFLLSHYKDSLGTRSTPRYYLLERNGDGPPKFVLTDEIDRSAEEMTKSAGGPTGRWKLFSACRLVRWMFEVDDPPTRVALGQEGSKIGIGEDTINEAMRLLGVRSIPPGERGTPWRLARTQPEWPAWLPGDRGGLSGSE